MAKRPRRDKQGPATPPAGPSMVPSASTLFRLYLMAPAARDMLAEALGEARPQMLALDQASIDRIATAETAEELLNLTAEVAGLYDRHWFRRVQAFGPAIAPLIAQRLRGVRDIPDRKTQSRVTEHLLGALGFFGAEGIEAIMACFDALHDYGKSLACVVLGHLGAEDSAERLWDFFQSVKPDTQESLFVGPLWGLVDLGDPRAADALNELLWSKRFFYETFAMAYKAADARVTIPLMAVFMEGGEELQDSAAWALVGLAHRVGRDALLAEIQPKDLETRAALTQLHVIVDTILSMPQPAADAFFSVFYQGLTPEMFAPEDMKAEMEVLDRLTALAEEPGFLERQPPPPGQRPSRNDPCWCGSGKKYKHCHWRTDREKGR